MLELFITLAAIAFTIILLKKEVNIGITMSLNCIFIAIGTRMPVDKAVYTVFKALFSERTIGLILILILIMMLENIMRTTGMIRQMVDNLKEFLGSRRAAAAILPAVLGLLPSPGGARFSCPMVEEVVEDGLPNEDKAFLNYWFRHLWLDGFILYPGLILAAALVKVPVIQFFERLCLFILVYMVIGILFVVKKIKGGNVTQTRTRKESLKGFLRAVFPILFIIGSYMALLRFTSFAMHIASMATVILLLAYKKYDWPKTLQTFKQAANIKFIIIVSGTMIFNEFLNDSGLVDSLVQTVAYYGIPKEILFVALPFITGVFSGVTLSFVSMTFPILIPLGMGENLWYAVVAFVSGFTGNMLTPLHLCCVMSADYFKVKISRIIARVSVAEVFMLVFIVSFLGVLYYYL